MVTMHGLSDTGDDVVLGTISLTAGALVASVPELQWIIDDGVRNVHTDKVLMATDDPQLYLNLLHYEYRGSALRATQDV